jgi:predicted amidophosphoribosyltransferase
MIKCPKCGREIKGYEEGWECCPYCGANLFVDCPYCDQQLEELWSYCPYCGKPTPKD